MSYEVLARKYRPLVFDDVVGQDHITRTLKRAVESSRLSHAYLFAGPRGCGKTSTARILARVINCDDVKDGNPCNECPSCRGVIAGNNLDVMEIDGASHTGVAEVRDLQESIGYTPSQYRNKVYIIDEVHMLSTHAFNALLKTLEEPPPHVYFVFATTAPHKIPDTIKSRCQRHHFKRLEIREIAGQLGAICQAENVRYDEDALRLLARKADGSMRDGTSLLDQCITSSGGEVSAEAVRDILGLIDRDKVVGFIAAIASGDPSAVLRRVDEAVNEGVDLQELAGALLEGYRDLMLLAAPGDLSDLLFRAKDEIELLRKHLERYELPDLVTVVERLCNATPRLKAAADPRVVLESLLVDLALLDRQVDLRDVIARLEGGTGSGAKARLEGGTGSGVMPTDAGTPRRRGRSALGPGDSANAPAAAASVAGSAPRPDLGANPVRPASSLDAAETPARAPGPEDGDLDLAKLRELWDLFVAAVRQKKVALGVCLIAGKVYAFDGERLTLRFARGFNLQREQVANPKNTQFLQRTFEKQFGRPVTIECFAEGEEGAVRMEERRRRQRTPQERLPGVSEQNKPIVKRIIDEFDGEIVRYNR